MSTIGFIGVGRLGLPVSVAITQKGHTVYAYDTNNELLTKYRAGESGLYEPNMDKQLQEAIFSGRLHFQNDLEYVIKKSEIILIAVQTPHPPELDGSVRFNHVRKDFDYSYLLKSCCDIAKIVDKCDDFKVVVIVSTVLPGTTDELLYPEMQKVCKKIGHGWSLIYSPSFIAMGTTIRDYLRPEFTLMGEAHRNSVAGDMYEKFCRTLHDSPIMRMRWAEAEGVKVWYNTFIGFKIVYANTIMQMCDKLNANCDVVTNALSKATDRLISHKYIRGGMGDGGGCHPRDNLALSYISDKLGLSYNLFDFVMTVREKQTEWLADKIQENISDNVKVVILGKTFKPFTNLTYGSPSLLLSNILSERKIEYSFYDPETDPVLPERKPSVYVIGTNWPQFRTFDYAPHSTIIDPWGMITDVPDDVKLISLGRRGD